MSRGICGIWGDDKHFEAKASTSYIHIVAFQEMCVALKFRA